MAFPFDRATRDRVRPGDGPHQAGLAHPVAAEHAGGLAHLRGHRNPTQRDGGAIEKIDVFDFQHLSAPQIDFDDLRVLADMIDAAL